MGSALIAGLLRSGFVAPGECTVVERRLDARSALEERFPGVATSEGAVAGDGALLAVKPTEVEALCRGLRHGSYGRILSVVAGMPSEQIESYLWPGARVVRAMTNTPALVGCGASAVAAGRNAGLADLEWAENVLSSVGVVVRLPERLLDAVTGLSGSGPAYVFLVVEALVEAGVAIGLDREASRVLTVQTVLGAARMLDETGESAEVLRVAVTSPGGTTAAGLGELEHHSVRAAMLDAVAAAARRSKELAAGL